LPKAVGAASRDAATRVDAARAVAAITDLIATGFLENAAAI